MHHLVPVQGAGRHAVNIGEAAKASSVSAKMIRYYERVGLIRPATRTAAGYRVYADTDVEVLCFLRRARDLRFSVDEMRGLLSLWRDRNRASADVKKAALAHVAELEATVASIREVIATLRGLAEQCGGDARPDCPIIGRLAADAAPARPHAKGRKAFAD